MMLERNPQPEISYNSSIIFDALSTLSGDRLNNDSRIMYSSIILYCDRNIPKQLHDTFIDLLQHADSCYLEKRIDLANRERVELNKNG